MKRNIRFVLLVTLLSCAAAANEPAQVRLTAEGKPYLEGIWTSGTLTPYERPLGAKAVASAEEIAAQQAGAAERFWAMGHRPDDVGRDNDAFIDDHMKLLGNGQTSLIVSPPDGRYPIRPDIEARRDFNLNSADTYETMSQWDRCITREPTALFPVIYNNAYQIVQTPAHIVIVAEMIHDARIVPLNAAGKARRRDTRVTSWGGDPQGRWDGQTLVIESTNFNEHGWIATGVNAGRLRGVPYSKDLRIVERFAPVDERTLSYEITIEDAQAFTQPLRLAYPLWRDDGYRMYEYACHEGNAATEMILRGARVQEAQAAR
jgi:hypothetical protein